MTKVPISDVLDHLPAGPAVLSAEQRQTKCDTAHRRAVTAYLVIGPTETQLAV